MQFLCIDLSSGTDHPDPQPPVTFMAREGRFKPTDNVLFIHTGGAGGLFAQDWEKENA